MPKRCSQKSMATQWRRQVAAQQASTNLKTDGSTACGCWIYSGVIPKRQEHGATARSRKTRSGTAGASPGRRTCRILYNRASARPDGTPWSERKKLVWWDEAKREWTGHDIADFTKDKPPDHKAEPQQGRRRSARRRQPFIMHPDGVGWL